jgi:hypothetical protein
VVFTVVSLLIVAAVGVSASSGKSDSANTLKNAVVAVFSGHLDQTGFHEGTTTKGEGVQGGEPDKVCKPPKQHHNHATHDRENSQCDTGDDSGSA